jgi:hypothetical protein
VTRFSVLRGAVAEAFGSMGHQISCELVLLRSVRGADRFA